MLSNFVVGLQLLLLGYFLFFAFYNFYYSLTSFWYRRPETVPVKGDKRVAVVIVTFNEKEVILKTLAACERISYPNKVIMVGDDSSDGQTYPLILEWFKARHARQVPTELVEVHHKKAEVHKSDNGRYLLFHRYHNDGFKAGNLKEVMSYLVREGIEYVYILDADWRPNPGVINKTLAVLDADPNLAFVQTKRRHYNRHVGFFQMAASLSEEAEYEVELIGRQAVNHPILFTGCSTLFRVNAIQAAGSFTPGHLTEDIDLTNRLYERGYKAAYIPYAANNGEVVAGYWSLIRQQERWAQGTARTFREFLAKVLNNPHLRVGERFSLLRQNAYYTTSLAIETSIFLAAFVVFWLTLFPESYQANLYLLKMSKISLVYTILLYTALASNFVPVIIAIFKRRQYQEIIWVPFSSWLYWSLLHTYFWANVKGFLGVKSKWFKTPKTSGKPTRDKTPVSYFRLGVNMVTLFVFIVIYSLEYRIYGQIDPYAFFWLPAMTVSVFVF